MKKPEKKNIKQIIFICSNTEHLCSDLKNKKGQGVAPAPGVYSC
jgi:hypothetical protein